MGISKEDIKEYTNEELAEKINDEQAKYTKVKFNHAISPLDNPITIKDMRRDVARLKTEMRKRQLEASSEKA